MRALVLGIAAVMCLLLLALSPSAPASAQSATATITITPIATRGAPYSSTSYALPSGGTLAVESRATIGETLILIVGLAVVAVLGARWVYDLAIEWGK